MRAAHYLPQLGLAVLTMLLLFRDRGAAGEGARDAGPRRTLPRLAIVLLAQVAAFACFSLSTASILEEHLAGVERPVLALALWAALALASTLLGVLLFLPLAQLQRVVRQRAGLLTGVCVLGATAWGAGYLAAHDLSLPLRTSTLWLAGKLLGLFESNYLVDVAAFDIRTFDPAPGFWVHIAPSCSGFEGMGLMAVFAVSYVWVFRGRLRFPQLLFLPLLGIAAMWLVNVVRLVALVLIGTHVSVAAAEGGFHSLGGTIAFCVLALVLVAVSMRWSFFSAALEQEQGEHERDATAAYLTPLLIGVATGMAASALGEENQLLQSLRVFAPAVALWVCRRSYALTLPQRWVVPLLLGVVAFAIWVGLPLLGTPRGGDPAALAPAAWLPLRILGSICVAPLVEELAFRGYLMRRLSSGDFEGVTAGQVSIVAWAFSSLLFGVLHGHWIAATLAGALYGYAYMRRGQLVDCIVAHAFTNLLLLALALATGDWSLI